MIQVVASFYPLAYAAEVIGGAEVQVQNLTSPGVEPHELELSPRQVDQVESAEVVLVLGRHFQPAVERVANRNRAVVVRLIDQLGVSGDDPHVWLDATLMARIADGVATALSRADPTHRDEYDSRASSLRTQLIGLDDRYKAGLKRCERHEIVTAHESFGRLASRYGLTQRAITGLSPEAEPNPARLAELTDLIRREGVTTVFTEELVSARVANTLAREAGVRTDVLNPLEGLSRDQVRRGENYITVMDANLAKLRAALDCT